MSWNKEDVYTDINKEVPLKSLLKQLSEYTGQYVPERMILSFKMEYYKDETDQYETVNFKENRIKIIRNIREELKDKVIHSRIYSYLDNVDLILSGIQYDKKLFLSLVQKEGEINFSVHNADVLRLLIEKKGEKDRIRFEYYPKNNSQLISDANLRSELLTAELLKPTKRGYEGYKPVYHVDLFSHTFKSNVQRDLIIPSNNPYMFLESESGC